MSPDAREALATLVSHGSLRRIDVTDRGEHCDWCDCDRPSPCDRVISIHWQGGLFVEPPLGGMPIKTFVQGVVDELLLAGVAVTTIRDEEGVPKVVAATSDGRRAAS